MAKRRAKSQIADWLLTIKSQESPLISLCRWCATYRWKAFNEDYNFALELTSIKGLHTKLWASKVAKVSILGISGLPETKWHLGAGLVARHREYYKGEGGGSPQVWAVMSLVSVYLFMIHPCIKSVPIMH
jgi:hypothetical protein